MVARAKQHPAKGERNVNGSDMTAERNFNGVAKRKFYNWERRIDGVVVVLLKRNVIQICLIFKKAN